MRGFNSSRCTGRAIRNTNTFEISKKNQTTFEIDTWLGVKPKVKATTKEDFYVTINKKDIRYLTVSLNYTGPIQAPIYKDNEIAKSELLMKERGFKVNSAMEMPPNH